MEITITIAATAFVIAFLLGLAIRGKIGASKLAKAEELAAKIIKEAEKEAQIKKKEALLEAKDEWYKAKANIERELQSKRQEFQKTEKRLQNRESSLDRKVDILNKKERETLSREKHLKNWERNLKTRDAELERLLSEENQQLERISGMTPEEAKNLLLQNLESQARQQAAQMIKDIKDKALETAEKEAKNIVISAIQRCAADHTVESTVSVVNLPSDEMKGRIIGREGRNIRSFETATGIDVIVDDTP